MILLVVVFYSPVLAEITEMTGDHRLAVRHVGAQSQERRGRGGGDPQGS